MAYSMPYTETKFDDGTWFVWNANGIITNACPELYSWVGKHKSKLLKARSHDR
jgi:hypothetical protein